MTSRLLLIVPALAVLALSGCNLRQAPPSAAQAQADADALRAENTDLKAQIANKDSRIAELTKGGGSVDDQAKTIVGAPIEGFEPTARGGVALPEDFAFAKGSDALNEAGEKAIAALAKRLNEGENASSRVIVEGHTDHTPVLRAATKDKFTDNWGLSAARGAAVVRALEKNGVSPTRLYGAFRGQHSPRVPVPDAKAKDGDTGIAANRRVEIYLSK